MTSHFIGIGNIHLAAVRANEEFHRLDSIQGAPAAETLIDLDLTLCYAPWVVRIDCARPLLLSSSMAEHPAVNRRVVGSSPT